MSPQAPSTGMKAAVFLAITFAISWGACIGSYYLLPRENAFVPYLTLVVMMTGPAIAAGICAALFERGNRREMLGLRWTPNPWWVWSWLTPVALAAISVVLTIWIAGRALENPGVAALDAMRVRSADVPDISPEALGAIIVTQAIIFGALINSVVLVFTEELGWRGYLHALWRRFGFWRSTLATGAIWGVWHAPAILLFGHNYPDDRVLGVGLFTVFCILLSVIMTVLRDRGRSVIAPAIAHGTLNAVAGVSILVISPPTFPWNGLIGIGGYIALAVAAGLFVFLRGNDSADSRHES